MEHMNSTKPLNQRSRKPRKVINLLDFVVIKKKDSKTQKLCLKKVSIEVKKRGKIKRKKSTTVKKKILRERTENKIKKSLEVVEIEEITEDVKELKLKEDNAPDTQSAQHSRNFREYCSHFITDEIRKLSEVIIKDLFRYQENKFQQNAIKAKANRRYVVGFKEVRKFLVVERLKLIFIAPDLEKNSVVDSLVEDIKALAAQHNNKTQVVFSLKRRKLGFLLLKKVPVSIVGIFDYQGTTDNVKKLLDHVDRERQSYKNQIKLS